MALDVGLIGMSHFTAPLEVREEFARACHEVLPHDLACVLLSTCNRCEIYFSGDDLTRIHTTLQSLLRPALPQAGSELIYTLFHDDCLSHLAGVTSGLYSAFVGESEIARQVRTAYAAAKEEKELDRPLHFLFQKALKISKEVRGITALSGSPMTLEGLLIDLMAALLGKAWEKTEMLFIGNSAINRKLMASIHLRGARSLSLCTRAPQLAEPLQRRYGVKLLPWEELTSWVQFPVCFAASSHKHPILLAEHLTESRRESRLLFDLAVPRSAEIQVRRDPKTHVLDIEEIGAFIRRREQDSDLSIERLKGHIHRLAERQTMLYAKREARRTYSDSKAFADF